MHDFATLLGYGADGICPYVAYEALAKMNAEGQVGHAPGARGRGGESRG